VRNTHNTELEAERLQNFFLISLDKYLLASQSHLTTASTAAISSSRSDLRLNYMMTGFFNLPPKLRKRIYREDLIRDGTTSLTDFKADCGYATTVIWSWRRVAGKQMPPLLSAHVRFDAEAASIYFSANHFVMEDVNDLKTFLEVLQPRHSQMIRLLTVEHGASQGKDKETLGQLAGMRKARCIRVIVNERALAERHMRFDHAINWHWSLGMSDQLKLRALYSIGLRALPRLAKKPHIELCVGDRHESRTFDRAAIKPYVLGAAKYVQI